MSSTETDLFYVKTWPQKWRRVYVATLPISFVLHWLLVGVLLLVALLIVLPWLKVSKWARSLWDSP
jgi:hypothetical protein